MGLTVPLWLSPLACGLAYTPWAPASWVGWCLMYADLAFVFCLFIAAGVVLVAPVLMLFRSRRRSALIHLGMAVLFALSFAGGQLLRYVVWRHEVECVTARGEPLVRAVHAFEAKHGRPPESLDQLVPAYLPEVPPTGIGAFPDFRYITGKAESYDGNPWVLIVIPPIAAGFDTLMYFPRQNYPATGYGGWLERVGDWAYVHE